MNYGEQLGYWYLRLNGCFPLIDFVLHAGNTLEYSSDCDLLAVRPPYVFEEIGGQPEDWDPFLSSLFPQDSTLGVICEVKTGAYKRDDLFGAPNLLFAVRRLGLVRDDVGATGKLKNQRAFQSTDGIQIVKLLLARTAVIDDRFFCVSITQVRSFLRRRFVKYRESKFRDRHFFPSDLIQNLIDEVHETSGPPGKISRPDAIG